MSLPLTVECGIFFSWLFVLERGRSQAVFQKNIKTSWKSSALSQDFAVVDVMQIAHGYDLQCLGVIA